ncbi:SPOR domain-containing protein [Flavobacterium sp. MK4S-17]|jgi:hypothetical protein|uniref:SPOR domain-containing protein n=1 Tax=Flavobacterium sp. MK4S-17 TaxID=2543737 RepID=UPI00135C9F51|nr:SPOR domain-containing protein [Flavobacterium sp. MK4S-17]
MRILKSDYLKYTFFIALAFGSKCIAQQQDVTVVQDDRFTQLLAEKRKLNPSIIVNDRYKIQIFYGDNDKARRTLSEFKRDFRNMEGTIVYENNTYKVWVGSFDTRIEAEKNIADIRKKYPYALMIRPNK